MEDEKYLHIVDEEGNETLYEILFTFDLDQFEKSYVVITPVGTSDDDEEEEALLHVASYVPEESGEVGELFDVESDEEWEVIEEVINTFFEEEDEDEEEEQEEK